LIVKKRELGILTERGHSPSYSKHGNPRNEVVRPPGSRPLITVHGKSRLFTRDPLLNLRIRKLGGWSMTITSGIGLVRLTVKCLPV